MATTPSNFVQSSTKRNIDQIEFTTPSPSTTQEDKKARSRSFSDGSVSPFPALLRPNVPEMVDNTEQLVAIASAISDIKESLGMIQVQVSATSHSVNAIQSDLAFVKTNLVRVDETCKALTGKTQSLSTRMDTMQTDARKQRDRIDNHAEQIDSLVIRLDENEDFNRRSNIRLVSLPEGEEGNDIIIFLQKQLPIWLPKLASLGTIQIERAHRIYAGTTSRDRSKTRTLLFRLLRYSDRKAIMDAYRNAGSGITHGNATLRLYADYSASTAKKRKAFQPAMQALGRKGVQNFLLYPAKLKVLHGKENLLFDSPDQAQTFVDGIQ